MKFASKILATACALFMLGSVFTSCSDDDDDKVKTLDVGVSLKNQSNGWRKALGYYAAKNLDQMNVNYTLSAATTGEQQGEQIKELVGKQPRVLVVVPEDGLNAAEVNAAIMRKIPVILGESKLEGVLDYNTAILFDNKVVGAEAGKYAASKVARDIVVLDVAQDPTVSKDRVDNFVKEATALNGITVNVTKVEIAQYTKADGKAAIAKLIEDGVVFDAVYAQDDEIALGVLEAVNEAEYEGLNVLIGCGGAQDFFNVIKDNKEINIATTLYSPKALIEECMNAAQVLLDGKQPKARDIVLPATVVDSENVEDYLDSSSPY